MSATSVFDVSSCMARFSLFSRLFFFFFILAKDLMESISSLRWLFFLIQSLLMTTSKVCVLSFNFQIQQYEKEIRELKSQLDNCTYEVKYFILM